MALHFHRIPIVLSARSLRKVVNFYKESTESAEYRADHAKCRSTTALLQSSIQRINEAKEDLQKLYREVLDEYKNCKETLEKREILAEIHQITEESELHTSIAEANDLIAILTAKLNESNNIQENLRNRLEYPEPGAQKVCAPTKDDSEIVQNIAENTEQNRNCVSLSSVSQTSYSSQNRCNPMALLKKKIATKAYTETRLGQKNNGRVKQSRAKRPNYRPNYGEGCIFCHKGNHSSTRCRTVSDQSIRRKALKEQNRCWKCFSWAHNSFVCQKQDCVHCGQKHHVSLCFKKYRPHNNYANKLQPKHMPCNQPDRGNYQNCGQRSNRRQSDRRKHASITAQMCVDTSTNSTRRVESSTSEQLVLMTAEGSVWNAGKQQYEKVLFAFKSGAQKTVIDEKLVEQFGLPKHMTEKCSISGIGGRVETFESQIVPLKIGTVFGEEIEMTVRTRPIITNGFPAVKLEQDDVDDVTFLKANDIFLASTKLRGEHQIPHVLVGHDYYHDLVIGNGARTPSGLHIAKTVFSHTIYGRGLSSVSQTKSVSCNLTAIREETEYRTQQENTELDGPTGSQRGKNPKYSGEIVHAYGFTAVPFASKENVTDFEHNCSVTVRKLRSPHLHPSALNSSRRRPVLHVKPSSTPSSRRSSSTPATRRRPSRPRAVFRRRPPQEVDHRRTTTTRKKAKTNDINSDNSCRPPEYHRQIDDPCSIYAYRRYCTSCGGGGADPSRARDTCS